MKTKTFLLLCLLTGFGLTQLSAQTGNEVGRDLNPEWEYWIPVYSSDGDQIDLLVGNVPVHYVYHFQNGIWISIVCNFYGEAKSVGFVNDKGENIGGTGEVFSIKDQMKSYLTDISNIGIGHCHAKGNMGSDYMIFYEYAYICVVPDCNEVTETYTFIKAVSPGRRK